ncbi:site-specific DNA-methyltransferase (cytosine-N4-specific) [Naumannella cuiyingiana]|uniref:Methyltransferase n=1 Tax=Naumannella cuiyingiana TaxID=1347891 RepID=A0A7Z0DCD6_9ACTN|nr:site-specific DNA-methyltransferase (cytosine-N4-specific) [Naumannella cuiyingiana]
MLDRMPAGSVQTIVTSPPYYMLRDYRGRPDQIGQEPTPDAYVEALVAVATAATRVLRPDGTFWLNLGDSYSSRANRGPSFDRHGGRGHRTGVVAPRGNTTAAAPVKSLLMMPARVVLALQETGWIVRNDVVWHKPNAMPTSATDRLATRHEHLFLLARRPHYYFDLDAIKIPGSGRSAGNRDRERFATGAGTATAHRLYSGSNPGSTLSTKTWETANPGDVWSIATRPNRSADHFAMFPIDIPLRCIAAGSRPGDLVLDPFSGLATTGRAALMLGRRYTGIDINAEYHESAAERLAETLPQAEDAG